MEIRDEARGMVPPNSMEAEISVLGAMLQDSIAVQRATEQLKPEDFYQPEHRELFQVMADLNRRQAPIDLTTLQAELSRKGTLEGVGGLRYLMRIVSEVPTAANVHSYIAIVREKSILRRLINACSTISKDSYSQQKEVPAILSDAEKAIFDIVMNQHEGEALKPISEVIVNTLDQIQELDRLKGEIAGVPTGFIDLDRLLTGLHPGELIVVGARPAMGKTSFAMNVAEHAALNKGKVTAVKPGHFSNTSFARKIKHTLLY